MTSKQSLLVALFLSVGVVIAIGIRTEILASPTTDDAGVRAGGLPSARLDESLMGNRGGESMECAREANLELALDKLPDPEPACTCFGHPCCEYYPNGTCRIYPMCIACQWRCP